MKTITKTLYSKAHPLLTVKVYHDNELKKEFTDQTSDACALGYLHRAQGNSADHAIRYEGWKVEVIDQDTGEAEFWKPYTRRTE